MRPPGAPLAVVADPRRRQVFAGPHLLDSQLVRSQLVVLVGVLHGALNSQSQDLAPLASRVRELRDGLVRTQADDLREQAHRPVV